MRSILTLNAGSSSLKFSVYSAEEVPAKHLSGQIDGVGLASPKLIIKSDDGEEKTDVLASSQSEALNSLFEKLLPRLPGHRIVAVGHRIVHGGVDFSAPMVLDEETIERLEQLSPFAPLHQPHNIAAVRAAIAAFPNAVQVGCFDTAFHRGHPWVNDTFALPRRFYEAGVRRFGFHGLSYEYLTTEMTRRYPDLTKGRMIVAHLGSGASLCAVRDGQSVGSTMGFSALDGLPMGTRCGQIDPGVLLYLMDHEAMTSAEISQLLYKESGLKGLSGITADLRVLEQSEAPEAREAIDYYVFRIRREIGAMTAVLGGLDALVFSGGVGENSALIRSRVCEGLEYLGVEIDEEKNNANQQEINNGSCRVFVLPTDEEVVIARSCEAHISAA